VRFLGPAWLAALDQALSASPAVAAATADVTLSLLQVVTGGPDGDVAHLVSVGAGRVRVASATVETVADVTMASTWDTAVAIATGHLVVRGDIEALRAGAPALAGLHEATESLRAATTY
jgi:hypothetical protein